VRVPNSNRRPRRESNPFGPGAPGARARPDGAPDGARGAGRDRRGRRSAG